MAVKRDSQRSKVYKSEKYTDTLPELKDWDEMCEYHARMVFNRRVIKTFAVLPWVLTDLKLVKTKGGRGSNANVHRISLGLGHDGHTARWVYLHELAHSITEMVWGSYKHIAGHGPEWCGVLLQLVLMEHGEESRRELSRNFQKGRVKVRHWKIPSSAEMRGR